MILNQDDSLVLIIDIQEKLLNAVFNKNILEHQAKILTQAATSLNIPIIITEQYPQGLGESIEGIKGNGKVYVKTSFNALADKALLNEIKNLQKRQIIVLGIETHICVHQTVNALVNEGFNVTVIQNACGSRSETEHQLGLENIKQKGALVKTTEMVLFELLKTAKHPNFKEIQALIK